MATATANYADRPIESVTLTLSDAEADALMGVLTSVGGDPKGPRGHIDDIATALIALGYDYNIDPNVRYDITGPLFIDKKLED